MIPELLFPVVGALLALLGWPLAARRIGPNRWYGLRVPATFADRRVWFDANALAGRDMIILGVALAAVSLLLPRIVRLDEGLFAVQACNGRGIALSTAIGHEFGTWLAGGARDVCAIPIEQPRAIPGYVFARYLPTLLMKATLAARQLRRAVLPRSSTGKE